MATGPTGSNPTCRRSLQRHLPALCKVFRHLTQTETRLGRPFSMMVRFWMLTCQRLLVFTFE